MTRTLDLPADELTTESGPKAHIVAGTPTKSGHAVVMEAMVNGTAVEALCGHVWVPSRDAKRLPVCDVCKEIYEIRHGIDPSRISP